MSYSDTIIPSARYLHDMAASGGAVQPELQICASFLTTIGGAAASGEFTGSMTVAGFSSNTITSFMQLLSVQGYEARLSGTDIFINW